MARVDVHERERDLARPERAPGQVDHHDRVLAAGEQQDLPLELRRRFPDDKDRLCLQLLKMGAKIVAHRRSAHPKVSARLRTFKIKMRMPTHIKINHGSLATRQNREPAD